MDDRLYWVDGKTPEQPDGRREPDPAGPAEGRSDAARTRGSPGGRSADDRRLRIGSAAADPPHLDANARRCRIRSRARAGAPRRPRRGPRITRTPQDTG